MEYGDLSADFDTTPQQTGAGMPKGNKKAGFVGLMIAKKHLGRRHTSDMYNPPPASQKKTPARFNSNAIQAPSNYILNAFPRRGPRGRPRRQAPAPADENVIQHIPAEAPAPRRRGRPAIPVAERSLNRAFRAGDRANLTEAQLTEVRAREAARQRASRQRRALARIQAMPEGPERAQAQQNYNITYGVAGAGMTGGGFLSSIIPMMKLLRFMKGKKGKGQPELSGGVRPTNQQFLDIVKTSYMKAPPNLVSDFSLVFASPTLDAWLNEPRKTIVVSVRGTDVSDKQDLYADANIPFQRLAKTPRYMVDKNAVAELFKRYDPKMYEYYLTGHSLGGAINNQLIRDFPELKFAMEYNPAFQPYDLISQQRGKVFRNYTDKDPLYRLGGRLFADKKVIPAQTTAVPDMGAVGTLYNGVAGHSLSNFVGAGNSHFGDLDSSLTKHQIQQQKGMNSAGETFMPRRLYTQGGRIHRGHFHLMSDGTIHSGATHTARSKPLEVR